MPRSSMATFSALWRAYGEGRLDRALHLVDPDCEFTLPDGRTTFRGHDGVRACLEAARRDWRTLTITYDDIHEERPGIVVGIGRMAASGGEGRAVFERPLACVAEFRTGRFVRGWVFGDPARALAHARTVDDERTEAEREAAEREANAAAGPDGGRGPRR
jgi:ketosteroid isomerase-like protein